MRTTIYDLLSLDKLRTRFTIWGIRSLRQAQGRLFGGSTKLTAGKLRMTCVRLPRRFAHRNDNRCDEEQTGGLTEIAGGRMIWGVGRLFRRKYDGRHRKKLGKAVGGRA